MGDTQRHMNYSYWSLNYQQGFNQSLTLLNSNYSSLVEFQNKFVRTLQKKVILSSHHAGQDMVEQNSDKEYFEGNLGTMLDELTSSLQHHFGAKLLTSTLIESDLVIPLNNFLTSYKSFKDFAETQLKEKFSIYQQRAKDVNKLETEFMRLQDRLNDLKHSTAPQDELKPVPMQQQTRSASSSRMVDALTSKFNSFPKLTLYKDTVADDFPGHPMDFPLVLGDRLLTFENAEQFSQFLTEMFTAIPKTTTKVPLTSYKLESINIADLSSWLLKNMYPSRPVNHGAVNASDAPKPKMEKVLSRSQVEKIGQALMDMQLIGITNIAKRLSKFRSDDDSLWFEYTELFKFAMEYGHTQKVNEPAENAQQQQQQMNLDKVLPELPHQTETGVRKISNPAEALKSITSLIAPRSEASGTEVANLTANKAALLEKFDIAYSEYTKSKQELEVRLLRVNDDIEKKEAERVKFVYGLFAKLTEILTRQMQQDVKEFEALQAAFQHRDNSENHAADLAASIAKYSPGSQYVVNPFYNSACSKLKALSEQPVPIFGSDVALQATCSVDDLASVPEFISAMVGQISPETWDTPFDYLVAVGLKNRFMEICKNSPTERDAIHDFVTERESQSQNVGTELLQCFKLYLLELSDSLIPAFVNESLVRMQEETDPVERRKQQANVIGTHLPKNNLAGLVVILRSVGQLALEKRAQLNATEGLGKIPFISLIARSKQAGQGTPADVFIKPDVQFYKELTEDLLAITEDLTVVLKKKEEQYIGRAATIRESRTAAAAAETTRHSRAGSYSDEQQQPRGSLKPFSLKERARSTSRSAPRSGSRSPSRRGLTLGPAAAIEPGNSAVDVLGSVAGRSASDTQQQPQQAPEIGINIIESSPVKPLTDHV